MTLNAHHSAPAAGAVASRPMRIAYVVHAMNQGGYERCVTHLCNHLDREQFIPSIICLDKTGPAAEWLTKDDVPIVELHKKPGNDWRVVGRLTKALRDHGIDIVQSHNWGTLMETTLARRRARTPVHVHAERGTVLGNAHGRGPRHWLRAKAMRWALERVDTVMSNAASVAARVEETCGYPAERVHIIPNGVERPPVDDPATARGQVRKQLRIPESAFAIGSVGRLHPVKGFDIAVEAISQLIQNGRDAHLILVGDGPEESRLRNLVESLHLQSRVHFPGRRTDIGRWLAAMDVFVNTSHSEGMSQSLVEAMASGLPLVVTDVGDNPDLVGDGDTACGCTIPSGEATAVAGVLLRLACDEPLRTQYSHRSRERHRAEFGFGQMIGRFESLYERLFASVVGRTHQNRAAPGGYAGVSNNVSIESGIRAE